MINLNEVTSYSEDEIISCLKFLQEKGVDLNTVPLNKTIGYLFDLRDSLRPN